MSSALLFKISCIKLTILINAYPLLVNSWTCPAGMLTLIGVKLVICGGITLLLFASLLLWWLSGKESICQRRRLREMLVQLLGWEDPLEKEMAAHSSILAWRIPWTEKTGGLLSIGLQKSWAQLME